MALKTITVRLSNGMSVTLPNDENLKEKVARIEAKIKIYNSDINHNFDETITGVYA